MGFTALGKSETPMNFHHCSLTTLEVEEVDGGFDLHVKSEGYDRVPFQIACDFVPGGELDFDSGTVRGKVNEITLLKQGYATYHISNDAISIGKSHKEQSSSHFFQIQTI